MGHYIVELAIWIFLAYLLGCFIGWLLRRLFGSQTQAIETPAEYVLPAPVETPMVPEPAIAAAKPVVMPEAEPMPAAPEPVMSRMQRPKGMAEARGGKSDNLQRINGIGPKNERVLHNLGFFHFDQIAAWTDEQITWVDNHLKFNGRIVREQWVRQAKLLANGEEEEFMRLFGANQPRA